jgi:F-type H+-transporting ATPase subunit b
MIEFIHVAHAAETAVEATSQTNSGGVLSLLGINWKLFIAQLINFSIIVFVLWRWVFRPVTAALTARTKKIEESLEQAKKIQEEKDALVEHKRQELIRSQEEYEKIVAEAQSQAGKQKQEILAEAGVQSEKMIKAAESRIASEREKMLFEVKEELAGLVIEATEKVIAQKLDPKKDMQLIKESLKTARKE